MTTTTKTTNSLKKFTSLFLALIMMLSVFGGLNMTAMAKDWKSDSVILDQVSVTLTDGDVRTTSLNFEKRYNYIDVVITSDYPMDVMVVSSPNDTINSYNITRKTHSFTNCDGSFSIKVRKGSNAPVGVDLTYTLTIYNRTPITSFKKVVAKKKGFRVDLKKKSGVTGYQIQYARNSKFTKNKKTVTIKGAKNTSKTIKKLKANKKYYVRVRTYSTYEGTRYYSPWSKAKTVTTKK